MIRFTGAALVALLGVILVGCKAPEMEMEPPQRPAELDRLETFAGTWEGTAEIKMMGSDEVMTSKGIETVGWEGDKWLLVSQFEYEMGDEGKMRGVGVMMWDAKAKKYRSWSFDSLGECESGTVKYDEETNSWHFKSKGRNLMTGDTYVGEATSKAVDDDTHEWNYTMWDGWKFWKLMEIKGTSHRK